MNWSAFTPGAAAIGGGLIGLAAVLLLGLNGRIAGISGVAGGLLGADRPWRLLFLLGLIAGAALLAAFGVRPTTERSALSPVLLVLAGLLVGYGSSWARGCTSGHGVCGLARLSLRSLVAVIVFLSVAVVVTALLRHGGVES